jgi:peroxiredoxin
MATPDGGGHSKNGSGGRNGSSARPGLSLGQPAPSFTLPDLGGRTVAFEELRDRDTVVVFWDPGCGFCQLILADIQASEHSPPASAPALLLISRGSAEENRALRLRAPVLMDPGWEVARSFGVDGTPMAVVVTVDGRIASELAVGGHAVMRLLRGHRQAEMAGGMLASSNPTRGAGS